MLTGTPAREALDSALVALRGAGVDSPRLDAELLLAHALGVSRTSLVLDPDQPVAGPAARTFRELVTARAVRRVPVAYLLGVRGFRRLELAVDQRVLVPRPETEHLVEAALELPAGTRVHDVGTGSGAVALALADERPDLVVSASDVSADALVVARANAARLGLEVPMIEADLLDGGTTTTSSGRGRSEGERVGEVDAVVANLPYVEAGARVPPELAHEPQGALLAGPDGLEAIRRLCVQLGEPARRATVGWVALEHGAGQARAVGALLQDAGFPAIEHVTDLAGLDRVTVGRRRPAC
jgi:release factor glutamine methyltransferase